MIRYLASRLTINFAAPDRSGFTPLTYAACRGHLNVIQFLARIRGVDLTAVLGDGRTPLTHAARRGGHDGLSLTTQGKTLSTQAESTQIQFETVWLFWIFQFIVWMKYLCNAP